MRAKGIHARISTRERGVLCFIPPPDPIFKHAPAIVHEEGSRAAKGCVLNNFWHGAISLLRHSGEGQVFGRLAFIFKRRHQGCLPDVDASAARHPAGSLDTLSIVTPWPTGDIIVRIATEIAIQSKRCSQKRVAVRRVAPSQALLTILSDVSQTAIVETAPRITLKCVASAVVRQPDVTLAIAQELAHSRRNMRFIRIHGYFPRNLVPQQQLECARQTDSLYGDFLHLEIRTREHDIDELLLIIGCHSVLAIHRAIVLYHTKRKIVSADIASVVGVKIEEVTLVQMNLPARTLCQSVV